MKQVGRAQVPANINVLEEGVKTRKAQTPVQREENAWRGGAQGAGVASDGGTAGGFAAAVLPGCGDFG